MIKIEPFIFSDTTQVRALLRHQDDIVPYESYCLEDKIFTSGLLFWQHWLPCRFHWAPCIYVAKENGVIIGLVSVASVSSANSCWQINHLVVHPNHRRRGIAQKLLQYIFALFGSQGVSHFVIEISCQSSPAMALLACIGFSKAARITHFQMPSENNENLTNFKESNNTNFRLALAQDSKMLYQLFQDSLPYELRTIYDYKEQDFAIKSIDLESEKNQLKKLPKQKNWYWVADCLERNVLTAAIHITSHSPNDFHLEFIIHPGWQHMARETINYAIESIFRLNMKGVIFAKIYDYQAGLSEILEEFQWSKQGEFLLLVKEHWIRAKKSSLVLGSGVHIPAIGKPAINLPYQFPNFSSSCDQ